MSPDDWQLIYLSDRVKEQDAMLEAMGNAINNLDARLMLVERVLATVKAKTEGKEYDEKKEKWWN